MKILVVDDEQDVQALFEQRFRRIRIGELHFLLYFREDALGIYENNHEAVLILSINMFGIGGLQLLEHIKGKNETPPPVVMMITAYGDDENYNQTMKLGADDFLTKPVDFTLKINFKISGYDKDRLLPIGQADLETMTRQKKVQAGDQGTTIRFVFACNGNDTQKMSAKPACGC